MNLFTASKELDSAIKITKEFYGEKRSIRTSQHYMRHILEGIYILDQCGCDELTKITFALHPLAQTDKDLYGNYDLIKSFDLEIVLLLMEYRKTANSYLTNMPHKNWYQIYLSPIDSVNNMLYADKIQNFKDFQLFFPVLDKRKAFLREYFESWLECLKRNVLDKRFVECYDFIMLNFTDKNPKLEYGILA